MSFSWSITPEEAWIPLYAIYAQQIEDAIVRVANDLTDEVTTWMQDNAPWTDRTGDARAALYSDVIHVVRQSVTLLVSHGPAIEYAIFLELSNGGRFSIIPDTVDWWGPRLFHEVQEIVNQIRVGG